MASRSPRALSISAEVVAFDVSPRVLYQTRPTYPVTAAVKRIEGTVVLDLWIGADGKVKATLVVESMARADVKFTLL